MTNPRDDLMALAPCPFCGGEAERIDIPTVGSDPELGGDPNAGGSCISCKRCAASTALHFDRKENLYSSWNDRAASRPAPVDREAVARALCESGKFETGEGTCSLLCMDQLGSVRKKGCNHLTRVHGKLVDSILSLLRPAETVENVQSDIVAQRTWFEGENVRTENLTADDIYQKPDATSDAVGEPVAWIITWSDGETSFTRSAPSASSPKNCKYQPLYTHPPKSPDTSAEEMREALLDATANLVGAASAYRKHAARHRSIGRAIADPFFTARAGDLEKAAERAQAAIRQLPTTDTSAAVLAERERCAAIADEWANKMALNYGRETANTIAAAIRQLPTTERGE